ncbi:MAG: hypothetical protein EBZ60_03210 [Betaproteobacteria bacterium]|nr:hypothetical protein [Betaproteobacteria bacterium]
MSQFIKLHPHHLMLFRDSEQAIYGELSFSVEQYGLLVNNFQFNLQLTPPNQHHEHWRFICEEPRQLNVPHFVLFLKSLENYIFSTLKFSPDEVVLGRTPGQAKPNQSSAALNEPYRLYFKNMFFDINATTLQKTEDTNTLTDRPNR